MLVIILVLLQLQQKLLKSSQELLIHHIPKGENGKRGHLIP